MAAYLYSGPIPYSSIVMTFTGMQQYLLNICKYERHVIFQYEEHQSSWYGDNNWNVQGKTHLTIILYCSGQENCVVNLHVCLGYVSCVQSIQPRLGQSLIGRSTIKETLLSTPQNLLTDKCYTQPAGSHRSQSIPCS